MTALISVTLLRLDPMRKLFSRFCFRFWFYETAIFVSCLLATLPCIAQKTSSSQSASGRLSAKEIAESLTSAVRPQQTAISPDGAQVAWVQPVDGPGSNPGIFVANLSAGAAARPQRVTAPQCAQCNEYEIAWSPDGKQIAFLSDAGSAGQPQLCVANVAGKSARKLTNLTGYLADPKWSRDGKQI